MKIKLDVVLVEGTNKQEFVDSFDPQTQADWWNFLDEIPNVISMDVEESFLEQFKSDPRIIKVEERLQSAVASTLPPFYEITDTITSITPSTVYNGYDFMGMQFYMNTDIIQSSQTLGTHELDLLSQLPNSKYFSRWTGKNVDIVTLEGGGSTVLSSYTGLHNSHPDFGSIDNPGTSRAIPMNWTDLESSANNQISTNRMFTQHSSGVLSVSGGKYCGFAKRANLRACYDSSEDGIVECINAIISWHNNKSINPETGVKNPTIMIAEYQWLVDRYIAVPIDTIQSITDLNGTVNKPVGGWGTDFTPFTSRNIIPWKVVPSGGSAQWCIVFPFQSNFSSLYLALEAAWDSGIIPVNAAGNNGGVYVKTSDPRLNGVYCTTSGTILVYIINWYGVSVTSQYSTNTIWYPFYMYGPSGLDKGIDVAAGQNSETYPILDPYSTRGPGIDIVGLGINTWSAYQSIAFADGNGWGMFSGTSCAAPTVVGILACLMEQYFTYNGSWPTPTQAKSILLNNAKSSVIGADSTTWSNVPSATTNYSVSKISGYKFDINFISHSYSSGNGGFRFTELAGTTKKRVFLNAQSFDRINTYGKRPISGKVYPRRKVVIDKSS